MDMAAAHRHRKTLKVLRKLLLQSYHFMATHSCLLLAWVQTAAVLLRMSGMVITPPPVP